VISSPNAAPRTGGRLVRLVVLHTAEGARTAAELGSFFANPANAVSSHVGIDDERVEQYVPYSMAAWTMLSANGIADQAELCGFAAWTRQQWLTHADMLRLAGTPGCAGTWTGRWACTKARTPTPAPASPGTS
jgi:hypothetical protein